MTLITRHSSIAIMLCRILFVVTLNVVMLSVTMLNVVLLSVIKLNVVLLNFIMLIAVMLSVVILSVLVPLWVSPGAVFTALHFLCNFIMGQISESGQAFPA